MFTLVVSSADLPLVQVMIALYLGAVIMTRHALGGDCGR